jgi:hypothetical protein
MEGHGRYIQPYRITQLGWTAEKAQRIELNAKPEIFG